MAKKVSAVVFWIVQSSALLIFVVPFSWGLVALWAVSHFLRAIGLTLAFHRYFAHRSFQMNRTARFVWSFIGTAAMQKGPLWWAGHHVMAGVPGTAFVFVRDGRDSINMCKWLPRMFPFSRSHMIGLPVPLNIADRKVVFVPLSAIVSFVAPSVTV